MFQRLCLATFTATALFATAAHADCKGDIQSILKATENSGPYRVEITTEANGAVSIMKGEVILPHSLHIKIDAIEMLMTPNGVWMSQGGVLQKMPNAMKDQVSDMIRQGMNMGAKAVAAPECLGNSDFEGGTYQHYKYDASGDFMGIATKSIVDLYVDDYGKPIWMLIDGEAMGHKSKTKQHITYDDSIVIADPK